MADGIRLPPLASEFVRGLTDFRFIATVTEPTGTGFEDFDNFPYAQWILSDDTACIAAIALHPHISKFTSRLEVGKRYVFSCGVLCHECGTGIITDDTPAKLFCVFTPQTKIVIPSAKSCANVTPLSELIARAGQCEFSGVVRHWTNAESVWNPENPSFRVILSDDNVSTFTLNVYAEGISVTTTVYPLLASDRLFVFAGGAIKMIYTADSLYLYWSNQTTVIPLQ
jgi:hypothetical protein